MSVAHARASGTRPTAGRSRHSSVTCPGAERRPPASCCASQWYDALEGAILPSPNDDMVELRLVRLCRGRRPRVDADESIGLSEQEGTQYDRPGGSHRPAPRQARLRGR